MNSNERRPEPDFTPASYRIRVDGILHTLTNPEPTAREILQIIGKDASDYALVLIENGQEKRILVADDNLDLRQPGVEEFTFASTRRRFVVYIDETRVEFSEPHVTGLQLLQAVGKQPSDHVVTQILPGVDDQFIAPDKSVDLRQPGVEKFTTVANKEVMIYINGQEKIVTAPVLSYEDLINLAYDNNPPQGPNVLITVNYRKGHPDRPEGSVIQGGTVKVKRGMIFNITATDQS